MSDPSVSVVIPAFNAAEYIEDALESIRIQTLRDVEVVVVDDGSSDATAEKVRRFPGLNLVMLRQSNAGPAAARNLGIRRARGRYCAFLDSDDVMLPERLSAQKAWLDAHSEAGLVHTDLMTFDREGVIHATRRAFSTPCGGYVLEQLLLDNFVTTSTVMAPVTRLREAGLFGEGRRVSEDFELWLRMAARWEFGYLDQPLVRYRRRSGSLSDDKLHTAQCALGVLESFWNDHPEYRRQKPAVFRRSLAKHLATAGTASLAQGSRAQALGYLLRSLRLDPWAATSWKSVAKVALGVRPSVRKPAVSSLGSA